MTLTQEQKYYLAKGGTNNSKAWNNNQLAEYNSDLSPNPTLNQSQTSQYYASQGNAANPMSPLDWKANQSATDPVTEKDAYVANNANPNINDAPIDTSTGQAAPVQSAGDIAMEKYYQSLMPSAEQTAATNYYNDLFTKSQLANEKALNSGDTLGFAAGEAQRVGRNFDIKLGGASRNVQAQAALAANRSTAAKARYEYEQDKIQTATEQSRYDTQQSQYQTQQESLSNPDLKLSAGQSNWSFNPETGRYEQTAAVPTAQDSPEDIAYRNAQIANINSQIAERNNNTTDDNQYVIGKTAKNSLLGLGLKPDEVTQLESQIRKYGMDKVIEVYDKENGSGTVLREILDKQNLLYL